MSVESNSLQKVNPEVLTKAEPQADDLLQARADVQANPHIRDLFKKAKDENWDRDGLIDQVATAMAKIWPFGDPTEAVSYLVDEFYQLEPGIYLTDSRTGKVVAILQEEDLYQPSMVPREGGGMAKPLRKIKPEIQAAIYLHLHESDREADILKALSGKTPQTDLVKEAGDYRLLAATRSGRKHIVTSLSKQEPKTLLEATGGSVGAFLRKFELVDHEKGPYEFERLHGTVNSKTSMKVVDQTTMNLQHNQAGNLQASVTHGWVRGVAKALSLAAHARKYVDLEVSTMVESLPGDLIIVPPELVRAVRKLNPKTAILPIEGAKPISITGNLGFWKVPDTLLARNFDAFDRWEVFAELEYTVLYNPSSVYAFNLVGVDPEVQVL